MASKQVPLVVTNGAASSVPNGTSSDNVPDASIHFPSSFKIHEVDSKYDLSKTHPKRTTSATDPPLGVLSNFTGTFTGTGFNLIFRPNSGGVNGTKFPNPVSPPPPTPPSENVLELNLTTETLAFSQSIGSVPNRGLGNQGDIFLNGIPYLQTIKDVTNPSTGKADGPGLPIHFEPGLWMHIPGTTVDPVLGESLARMASIPHGTTINAQCLAPTNSFDGPPDFTKIIADPTPFPVGGSNQNGGGIRFLSQDIDNVNTPRLPQDLSKFKAAGTITQDILNNPNLVLQKAIANQKITRTIVFTVSTVPQKPELGGGTANIAFLVGDPNAPGTSGILSGANASAFSMQATFWIETVEKTINVPVWKPGQSPIFLPSEGPHPPFSFTPPHEILQPKEIIINYTQIQYSQTVLLNFATLSWPHISVATLVPGHPVTPHINW